MGRLIFSVIESLDGYAVDADGRFDWAEPDETVHSFINRLERDATTYLYGRRMYEVMAVWETMGLEGDVPPYIEEYAQIWRAAEKIVYSTTLAEPHTSRTRIERSFDPAAIRRLKDGATGDISVGGPALAAHAIAAGLVDEYQLFIAPVVVGGGTRSLPDGVRFGLELVDQRSFANGMVFLRYRGDSE